MRAMLGTAPMALDAVLGHAVLQARWPVEGQSARAPAFAAAPGLRVEPGQRYVVARGVAIMPLRGLLTPNMEILERYLGWSTHAGIEAAASELAAMEDVRAVVIPADSPGGYVLGLQAAVEAVRALAAIKPVHVLVDPMAASAAYAIASQATDITMVAGSSVGSIGVMRYAATPVAPDNGGDQWSLHVSSHAQAKIPDPGTEKGRAEIQRDLDVAEAEFHANVAAGRGIAPADLAARLSVTDDDVDGGAVFGPADAIARGLADRQETRAAFWNRVFGAYAPKPAPGRRAALAASALAVAQAARAKAGTI